MKISNSIRTQYYRQLELNSPLETYFKDLIEHSKPVNWFYKGRLKQLESFAQKLETGRFDPSKLEDFFACTIVVENKNSIPRAIELVESYCDIVSRRPANNAQTSKYPDQFSFDDLRLYVKVKESESGLLRPWDNLIFEVQIKTFLQHAWAIATHDLNYKGSSISWSKARLAFQIKAMLEHAEISIEKVDAISSSIDLSAVDPKTAQLLDILEWLKITWEEQFLPQNIVGLAQTLSDILFFLRIELRDIQYCIQKDNELGFGAKSTNLSPYQAIIKSIINHKPKTIIDFFNDTKVRKGKLLITPEMEIDDRIASLNKQRMVMSYTPTNIAFLYSKEPFKRPLFNKDQLKSMGDFFIRRD